MFDSRIVVAIPSTGEIAAETACDAMAVCAYTAMHLPRAKVQLECAISSILLQNRHNLWSIARERKSTHILWVDSDMTFPADSLAVLLRHDKPIVAANYTTRKFPVYPLAAKNGQRVSSAGKSGLEEVDHIGFGLMLTRMDLFEKLEKPLFYFGWHPKHEEYIGEDVWFCNKARKAGFPTFIDHDLSQKVRHLGKVEFGFDMISAETETK